MTQITVPPFVAIALIVISAMLNFAIVNATQVALTPEVLYALGIVNIGVTTAAIALNVKQPPSTGGAA